MSKRDDPLRLLAQALRGGLPAPGEWQSVVELASRGWLVPALHLAMERSGHLAAVPREVRDYLELLHDRNRQRNARLRAQLTEAVAAFNDAGIRPVLMKGAIHLFTGPEQALGARISSDLDLAIAPDEFDHAVLALQGLGYRQNGEREFGREQDAGEIELHMGPSDRSAKYLKGDLRHYSKAAERSGATALIPSATAQALHLIVHDMIKEGDYWRLRLDLRHLHDLAELASRPDGVDWLRLTDMMPDKVGRRAVAMQAAALRDLYAIEIPADLGLANGALVRHRFRKMATTLGTGGAMARLAGNLSWGTRRMLRGMITIDMSLIGRGARYFTTPAKGSRV
ncbi:nucleotidyltransferase family protein [Sphingomonas sp. GCM10030256]|uniref:nucleotidyltransferase family protein n=1 Tax=Sphingomonas sp. GCM10030256 TaxID=3273427 RepID=UPI003622B36A